MSVVIISTGGTIASTKDSGGGASPELTGDDLLASVPGLSDDIELSTDDFSNIPSPQFSISQMHRLSALVAEYDRDDTVDGIVVTQGTDTLEEVAYFVDLCYDGDTPVAFTGAMRNPSLASPDGPANLLTAIRTVTSDGARGRGVLIAFNDQVHAAKLVTKTHSMRLDTFQSPELGPLAVHDEETIRWRASVDPTPTIDVDPETLTNEVAALTVTAEMPTSQIPEPGDFEAVVLAATGSGHIPPGIIPPLEALARENVTLVATTRCSEGRLARSTYDYRGSEQTLLDLGCYFSERNLQKTRIATVVALTGRGVETVFDRPARE